MVNILWEMHCTHERTWLCSHALVNLINQDDIYMKQYGKWTDIVRLPLGIPNYAYQCRCKSKFAMWLPAREPTKNSIIIFICGARKITTNLRSSTSWKIKADNGPRWEICMIPAGLSQVKVKILSHACL